LIEVVLIGKSFDVKPVVAVALFVNNASCTDSVLLLGKTMQNSGPFQGFSLGCARQTSRVDVPIEIRNASRSSHAPACFTPGSAMIHVTWTIPGEHF
jgi:hypothetical protein